MDSGTAGLFDQLVARVAASGSSAVAYSGGVDSSLLLKAASVAHGDKALGLIASTPMHPSSETARALENASEIGVRVEKIDIDPLADDQIRANPRDRCYFCKKRIYTTFLARLVSLGREAKLLDGTNLDDLNDHRPGRRALEELGVKTPLLDTGLTKSMIRSVARNLGLRAWDYPSSSCLATRITSGFELTRDRLEKVAQAEAALAAAGFAGCRVRLFSPENDFAGVELARSDLDRFISLDLRGKIGDTLAGMGFVRIFIDIDGRI